MVSLESANAGLVGAASDDWTTVAQALARQGLLSPADAEAVAQRQLFGQLIGNTDMHAGNLSFISSHGRPYQLSPAYDVLPMGFAPNRFGELNASLAPVALLPAIPSAIWHQASQLATVYLDRLRADPLLSRGFAPCLQAMHQHLFEAQQRISRLA